MRIPFFSSRRSVTPRTSAEILGQIIYVFDADGVAKPVGQTSGKAQMPVAAPINVTNLNVGPVTLPDGADVTQGTKHDAQSPWPLGAHDATMMQILAAMATVLGTTGDASVEDTAQPASLEARLTAATHFLANLRDQISGSHVSGNLDAITAVLGIPADGIDGTGADWTVAASIAARLTQIAATLGTNENNIGQNSISQILFNAFDTSSGSLRTELNPLVQPSDVTNGEASFQVSGQAAVVVRVVSASYIGSWKFTGVAPFSVYPDPTLVRVPLAAQNLEDGIWYPAGHTFSGPGTFLIPIPSGLWTLFLTSTAYTSGILHCTFSEGIQSPFGIGAPGVPYGAVGSVQGVVGGTPLPVVVDGSTHHAASAITIATGAGALAARATRTSGMLKARKANAADIVIEASGYHLAAGESLLIHAVDAYAFTGTNGDIVDVYEEYN